MLKKGRESRVNKAKSGPLSYDEWIQQQSSNSLDLGITPKGLDRIFIVLAPEISVPVDLDRAALVAAIIRVLFMHDTVSGLKRKRARDDLLPSCAVLRDRQNAFSNI
jgi:hypothetical protein